MSLVEVSSNKSINIIMNVESKNWEDSVEEEIRGLCVEIGSHV